MKFDPKFLSRLSDAENYNQATPGYMSGGDIMQKGKDVPFTGTDGKEYSLRPNGDVIGR